MTVGAEASWVLLVGQDPDVREMMQHLLELRGLVVRTADAVADVVEQCRTAPPAVIVAEAISETSDWARVGDRIAEELGAASPPVVVITGSWGEQRRDSSPNVRTVLAPHRAELILDLVSRYCRGLDRA